MCEHSTCSWSTECQFDATLEGDVWFSRRIIDILARPTTELGRVEINCHLTDRETEVLYLMANGLANSPIADTLAIG